jgi:hypothetical protein
MYYCLTSTLLLACLLSQQLTRLLVPLVFAAPSPARFCLLSSSSALYNTTFTKRQSSSELQIRHCGLLYNLSRIAFQLQFVGFRNLWNLERSLTGPLQHYHGAQ